MQESDSDYLTEFLCRESSNKMVSAIEYFEIHTEAKHYNKIFQLTKKAIEKKLPILQKKVKKKIVIRIAEAFEELVFPSTSKLKTKISNVETGKKVTSISKRVTVGNENTPTLKSGESICCKNKIDNKNGAFICIFTYV